MTPTVSFPGLLELPVTLLPASTLVQPPAPGLQTCVWKYSKRPLWKKIACASAPYQGVSLTGLPCGSVSVIEISAGSIARSFVGTIFVILKWYPSTVDVSEGGGSCCALCGPLTTMVLSSSWKFGRGPLAG